jgi:phasin family protein
MLQCEIVLTSIVHRTTLNEWVRKPNAPADPHAAQGTCRTVPSEEKTMTNNFEEFQKYGKEQLEAATTVAASLAKGLQTIAAETTDYSKKSLESSSAFVEKILGAKSLDNAIQIHSEYAKSAYEGFVAQATKMGELYTNLAKEAFKPVETAFAKVQATVSPK